MELLENVKLYMTPEALATAILLLAGVIGVLLVMLCANVRFPARRTSLKKYRSAKEGVNDLLMYGFMVEDGIIVNKDGALMVSYALEGADSDNLMNSDRAALTNRLNEAFVGLGTGWMIHFDVARFPAPAYSRPDESHFPDPVSAAMDEERRRYFTATEKLYEGIMVLTVTYFPPSRLIRTMGKYVYVHEGEKKADAEEQMASILAGFKNNLKTLEDRLSGAFPRRRVSRLRSFEDETESGKRTFHDQLKWIHYCLTGEYRNVAMPSAPVYLDCLLASKEIQTGVTPRIGNQYIQVVAINGFPATSTPGMLDLLSRLSCEYRWNTRFIFLDQEDALKRIKKITNIYKQQERGLIDVVMNNPNPRINTYAVEMREQCEQMAHDVRRGDRPAGFYNSNVILRSNDYEQLQREARFVQKTIEEMGFPARIETENCMEAFLGTMPGHHYENCRLGIINTMNLSHLLPTSSVWPGHKYAPCPYYPPKSPALMYAVTSGSTPFRLNLHCGDIGHTLIIGPTGSGKSVLLATLISQFLRYKNVRIFAFDKGNSLYTLCKAVGGNHYDLAGDEEKVYDKDGNCIGQKANYAFCPLQNLSTKEDQAWAARYIEALCNLGEPNPANYVNDVQQAAIKEAIMNMASADNDLRSLEYFHAQVADLRVKSLLKDYTKDGFMGYMLAADRDDLDVGANYGLNVFETESLMGMGDDRYRLPVLLYLFRQIDRSLKNYDEAKGIVPEPSVIVLDEAWTMLANPVFRAEITRWLRELRKKNCCVIMATQSLTDAVESGILNIIRESCPTKIFLPNPYARHEESRKLYAAMNLNDRQIDIIANAVPKRQYYFSSLDGARLFELALGEKELPFLAVSDRESLATVRELIKKNGDDPAAWIPQWLKTRGVPPNAIGFNQKAS